MALYGMLGRLTYVADTVQSLEDGAQARAGKLPAGDRLRRQLETLATSLEGFRATLVATGPGGWLSGEEQLREKMAKVYGGVNGYDGRPSAAQVEQVKVLGDQLTKAEARLAAVQSGEVAAVNRELRSASSSRSRPRPGTNGRSRTATAPPSCRPSCRSRSPRWGPPRTTDGRANGGVPCGARKT